MSSYGDNKMVNLSHKRIIEFYLTYPNTESKWLFGVAFGGKLVGITLAIPFQICIGKGTRVFINATIRCIEQYKNR